MQACEEVFGGLCMEDIVPAKIIQLSKVGRCAAVGRGKVAEEK